VIHRKGVVRSTKLKAHSENPKKYENQKLSRRLIPMPKSLMLLYVTVSVITNV